MTRILLFALALAAAAPAAAQTAHLRLRVVANDARAGGTLRVVVEARHDGQGAPTLASATLDLAYDADALDAPTFEPAFYAPGAGYALQTNGALADEAGAFARLGLTSEGVGPDAAPGMPLETEYQPLGTWAFAIARTGATTLHLREATPSLGVFETAGDGDGSGAIDELEIRAVEPVEDVSLPVDAADVPASLELAAAYPNPMSTRATLRYAVPTPGRVRMEVFDVLGRRVAVLADGVHASGSHEARLDAQALRLTSGVYFVRLAAADGVRTQRVTVVR